MTKAVEPLTEAEISEVRAAVLCAPNDHWTRALARLLATIEADREKLAHVQGLANRRGIRATQNMRAWHRTRAALEAAEARIAELEDHEDIRELYVQELERQRDALRFEARDKALEEADAQMLTLCAGTPQSMHMLEACRSIIRALKAPAIGSQGTEKGRE